MKKQFLSTIYLCTIYCLFSLSVAAQSMKIDWAVKDASPFFSKELICDKDSNVYIHGSPGIGSINQYDSNYDQYILAGTDGSFLQKYSPQGKLIFDKRWQGHSFFIQKIIYDGDQAFYFTGLFAGSFTVDGISISSKGRSDAMIGKMSTDGTILQVTTFGSSADEMGHALCFGPSQNSLVLAGNITDSLVVNNVFLTKNTQQTMLVAQFSLSGAIQNYKLYDFLPQRNSDYNGNFGREIYAGPNGNYFLLADRQGSHLPTYPDSITATIEGKYVMKLNSVFDTLWTKYIIGPTDYGSWCRGLKVSVSGDPYIISHYNEHYGGIGSIKRLDPNNGSITWYEDHQDGGYADIFVQGNTLYTCGTDSATYCPCQDQNYGYQDVKIFDQNNTMTGIIKFDAAQYYNQYITFQNITRDKYGNTFVSGHFYTNTPYIVFGQDTVWADPGNTYGDFLLKLNDVTATTGIAALIRENNFPLNVFPNPASNAVTINFSSSSSSPIKDELLISIKNSLGQTVYSENKKDFSGKYENTIDLSKQSKGIYFVEMVLGNECQAKKIVIE